MDLVKYHAVQSLTGGACLFPEGKVNSLERKKKKEVRT